MRKRAAIFDILFFLSWVFIFIPLIRCSLRSRLVVVTAFRHFFDGQINGEAKKWRVGSRWRVATQHKFHLCGVPNNFQFLGRAEHTQVPLAKLCLSSCTLGNVREKSPRGINPRCLRKWRLPTLPQYSAVQYHRRCCLSAPVSLPRPRPLPRAAGAHSPHPTPSATADTACASEAGLTTPELRLYRPTT